MEEKQKTKLPVYGDEKYLFDLAWNDETKRDDLVIIDAKPINEVMNARAKGTTVYDLINTYGGIDAVTAAFADRGVYTDVSDVPEVCNDDSYGAMIQKLQAQIDALKQAQIDALKQVKGTEEAITETVTKEEVTDDE